MNAKESIFHKKIKLREQNPKTAEKIQKEFKVNEVVAQVLAARGYEADETLEHFLNPTLAKSLPDPKLLKNLDQASEFIAQTIASKGKIAVCSDFDVDGLTSAALIKNFFQDLSLDLGVYVPNRFTDGYGLNTDIVDRVKQEGHDLLICVDFGTSNHKELSYAKEQGLKTIVIDHHHIAADLPPADVFINPHQAGCNFADKTLCAAGLTWYLLIALKKELNLDLDVREYLDLAALGTICDMVPLTGVNRVITQKGLERLSATKRCGILALKEVIGIKKEVTCYHVGFGIGPRINAAGRMLDGEVVVELLSTKDAGKAKQIASRLNRLNSERQEVEAKIKKQAVQNVNDRPELPSGIVVWGKDYHTGVIGIVAQRLVEKFYRPAVVMGYDQGNFKGSVRGIPGFSVVEALEKLSDYFSKFGGHSGAGGFSLKSENPEDFAKAFEKTCADLLTDVELVPSATADAVIEVDELDTSICEELKALAPFGIGNPSPQILIKNLKVRDVKVLKGAHLKSNFTDGKIYLSGLMWNSVRHPALYQGSNVDLVCKPEVNFYNGLTSVQLNLQAVEEA